MFTHCRNFIVMSCPVLMSFTFLSFGNKFSSKITKLACKQALLLKWHAVETLRLIQWKSLACRLILLSFFYRRQNIGASLLVSKETSNWQKSLLAGYSITNHPLKLNGLQKIKLPVTANYSDGRFPACHALSCNNIAPSKHLFRTLKGRTEHVVSTSSFQSNLMPSQNFIWLFVCTERLSEELTVKGKPKER